MFCPALDKENADEGIREVKNAIMGCKLGKILESGENSVPTTAYVTKMQPFDAKLYDITTRAFQKSAGKTRMIAICRVFSGILRVGQKVFVMGPKHQLNGQ